MYAEAALGRDWGLQHLGLHSVTLEFPELRRAFEKGVPGVSSQLDARLGLQSLTLQASVPAHPRAEPPVVVDLGPLDPFPRVPPFWPAPHQQQELPPTLGWLLDVRTQGHARPACQVD